MLASIFLLTPLDIIVPMFAHEVRNQFSIGDNGFEKLARYTNVLPHDALRRSLEFRFRSVITTCSGTNDSHPSFELGEPGLGNTPTLSSTTLIHAITTGIIKYAGTRRPPADPL